MGNYTTIRNGIEGLNERTHPDLYARARRMLEACDWYDYDESGNRMETSSFKVDEDAVISTMIRFAKAEIIRSGYRDRGTDITDDGYVWYDKRLKPCPFCGILGVAFCEGRPPRWREMYCVFCYDAPDGTAEEKALDLFERGLEIWNMRA